MRRSGTRCWPTPAPRALRHRRRDRAGPTTSTSTAAAIRAGSRGRTSRWRAGSSPWPTPSTRSRPTDRTGAPAGRGRRRRSCARSAVASSIRRCWTRFLAALDAAAATLTRFPRAPRERPHDEYVPLSRRGSARMLTVAAAPLGRRRAASRRRAQRAGTGASSSRTSAASPRRWAPSRGCARSTHRSGRCPGPPRRCACSARRSRPPPRSRSTRTSRSAGLPSGAAGAHRRAWLSALADAPSRRASTPRRWRPPTRCSAPSRTHGTTLLERHAFLERFGQVLTRALGRQGAAQRELAEVRRLIVALQQPRCRPTASSRS